MSAAKRNKDFYVLVSQYLSHFSKNITLSKKIIARFFPILMTRFKTLREYLKALQTFYHAFNLITGIHALNLNTGFFALKLWAKTLANLRAIIPVNLRAKNPVFKLRAKNPVINLREKNPVCIHFLCDSISS